MTRSLTLGPVTITYSQSSRPWVPAWVYLLGAATSCASFAACVAAWGLG